MLCTSTHRSEILPKKSSLSLHDYVYFHVILIHQHDKSIIREPNGIFLPYHINETDHHSIQCLAVTVNGALTVFSVPYQMSNVVAGIGKQYYCVPRAPEAHLVQKALSRASGHLVQITCLLTICLASSFNWMVT